MKKCSVCKTKKEVTEFNRDGSRKDGMSVRCRPCDRLRDKIQKGLSPDNPKRIKRLEYLKEYMRQDREKNPLKWETRKQTRLALARGDIKKTPCVVCGGLKVEAHHTDYSLPLEVIWLCHLHHIQLEHGYLKI